MLNCVFNKFEFVDIQSNDSFQELVYFFRSGKYLQLLFLNTWLINQMYAYLLTFILNLMFLKMDLWKSWN